jgi:hypothetical protein
VPCLKPAGTIEALTAEAEALWRAEQPDVQGHRIAAAWGCVAALFTADATTGLNTAWTAFFRTNAQPIVPTSDQGLLEVPWPTRSDDGSPYDADVLLATATKAASIVPSPEDVADAWIDQDEGFEVYFFNNVRHGIRTENDLQIWKRMKERNPHWLAARSYSDVASLLDQAPG